VRPTDENQAASTRPNLMSSRRAAGEENILAMLERDSARRPGTRMSGIRLASYGAAAALVGILAGGIAWLAYDNHETGQELIAQHELANPVPPALAEAPPPQLTSPAPAPAPANDAPRTAVIVDESAPPRDTAVASAPPPLVMLPPHELGGAKPAPTPRPVPESVEAKPAKAEAPPTAVEKKVIKVEAPTPALRPAADKKVTKAAAPAAAKKTDKPAKTATRAGKPAKARTVATAKAKPDATRQRKAAAGGDTAVDSDVALISAIIQHSERHRGEREAAGPCKGPHCARKPGKP